MVEALGRLTKADQLSLRERIAAEMHSIRVLFCEAEKLLRDQVQIDPQFKPFAQWCFEQRFPLTVLSAGSHQIIELFVRQDEFLHLGAIANELRPDDQQGRQCVFRDHSDYGHDKAQVLHQANEHGCYNIFIGDGFSDRRQRKWLMRFSLNIHWLNIAALWESLSDTTKYGGRILNPTLKEPPHVSFIR